MQEPFTDPLPFRRFKSGARRLHEAGKVGKARRLLDGSRIQDAEIVRAIATIDAWLDRQPEAVREYALAKPEPRVIQIAAMREP